MNVERQNNDVLNVERRNNDVLNVESRKLSDDDDLQKTKRQRIAEWLEHRSKQSEEVDDSNDDEDKNKSK